jgi:hypothetical protein
MRALLVLSGGARSVSLLPTSWARPVASNDSLREPLSRDRQVIRQARSVNAAGKGYQIDAATLDRVHFQACVFDYYQRMFVFIAGKGPTPKGASGREIRVLPPGISGGKHTMPHFRCDMLDECGDIVVPTDILAESLGAAILQASRIQNAKNRVASPSRWIHSFESWTDSGRAFP